MKKGDLVIIRDFSWSTTVKNGELQEVYVTAEKFVVVEIDCRFPKKSWQKCFNNTVIQAVDSGEVVFIEERFLRPAFHIITIDGKTINISNESYQALKKSLEQD